MRIDVAVTMDDGTVLRGTTNLLATEDATRHSSDILEHVADDSPAFNFSLPMRAFMKRYAEELSGPKKLTLLIAYLTRGTTDKSVLRVEVEKSWKKMSGLLGGAYNAAYDTRARDNGWISSPKAGTFQLLEGWADAVSPSAA